MKYNIPLRRFNVCAVVFVQAMTWATIIAFDFQGFPHLEIVRESLFVFIAHGFEDRRAVPINLLATVLFMLAYPRVMPVAFFTRCFVLLASIFYGPYGLANIYRLRIARAFKQVDSFFIFLWGVGLVLPTEDVNELFAGGGAGIDASF